MKQSSTSQKLKLSFADGPTYHTLRYDFKPASVNREEPAILELDTNGQVTIKAPNVGGSSSNHTVFKGQRRPHIKECLLIIDNKTGEMVLQKLTDNVTVKATRTFGGGGGTNTSTANSNNNNNNNVSVNGGGGGGGGGENKQNDGPQLSEESSSSSDESSSSSSSDSSSSHDEGFTF